MNCRHLELIVRAGAGKVLADRVELMKRSLRADGVDEDVIIDAIRHLLPLEDLFDIAPSEIERLRDRVRELEEAAP